MPPARLPKIHIDGGRFGADIAKLLHVGTKRFPWTGVGDYKDANGNTEAVNNGAHSMRDGNYDQAPADTEESSDIYDLVVVGGGIAGLTAALLAKARSPKPLRILILENHPIFGGEARRNDFIVDGVRLEAPQGSKEGAGLGARDSMPKSTSRESCLTVGVMHSLHRHRASLSAKNGAPAPRDVLLKNPQPHAFHHGKQPRRRSGPAGPRGLNKPFELSLKLRSAYLWR